VAPLWAAGPNLWQFLPAPPKSLSGAVGGKSLEGAGADALTVAALRLATLIIYRKFS
jgi:hypothetical protein